MCMIQTRSTSWLGRKAVWPYAVVVATLLIGVNAGALAQARGGASKVEWPKTFGGQPDFEFTKAEVLEARTKNALAEGDREPKVPTVADLLGDEKVTLISRVVAVVSGTDAVSDTESAKDAVLAKLAGFNLAMSSLPSVTEAVDVNLDEFKGELRRIVRKKVADFDLKPGRYSLDYVLNAMALQAVVTSPMRYAVINGEQYREGESFRVSVKIGPSDGELLDALAAALPAEGTVPEAQALRYQEAYEDMVKELAANRQANPIRLQRTFSLPVTILAIQSRKVTVEFNGQRHDLLIKYAY